jgi:hypothetical protein
VIVLDDRQPGPPRLTGRRHHPQVQQGVVGLPDLVRPARLAPVHQIEHLPVPLGDFVRQGGHRRIQAAHDVMHRGVTGHRPPLLAGHRRGLPVHRGDGRRRAAQRQALDQQPQIGGHPVLPPVGARMPGQGRQPAGPVRRQPPPQRPLGHPPVAGYPRQRNAVLQMRPQRPPPVQRLAPLPGR